MPPAGPAASTTAAPEIGFPNWSFTVTVTTLASPEPRGDSASTVDCAADTGPGVTVSCCVCEMLTLPAIALTVFAPGSVEWTVAVATPDAFVGPDGWVMVFEPLTNTLTLTPGTGLPEPSRAVTVIVETEDPELAAIEDGEIATVEFAALTVWATTSTVAVCAIAPTPVIVAVIVFAPWVVELIAPVVTPDAFVRIAG